MSTKITDLRPAAAQMASVALANLKTKNIPVCVTSTLRTETEQQALYAQGRQPIDIVQALRKKAGMPMIDPKENTYTVTNCDGIKNKSRHQGGTAIDVVPANEKGNPIWPKISDPRWRVIADEFKAVGFINGLDWPEYPDAPHHELWEV